MEVRISTRSSTVVGALICGAVLLVMAGYFLYEPVKSRLFGGIEIAEESLTAGIDSAQAGIASLVPDQQEASLSLPEHDVELSKDDGPTLIRVAEVPSDFAAAATELASHYSCTEALVYFFDRKFDVDDRSEDMASLTKLERAHLRCKVVMSNGKIAALTTNSKEQTKLVSEDTSDKQSKEPGDSRSQLVGFALRKPAVETEAVHDYLTLVDGSGKYSTEARVTGVKVLEVTLEKRSGDIVSVPLSWLSDESKAQVSESLQQHAIANAITVDAKK